MTDLPARTKRRISDENLILALLQHPTFERAATAAGVSEVTLWRRMKESSFREAYSKARRETFRQAIIRLQHASSAAVSTLLRVMTDQTAPAASRVRAANSVLQHSLTAMEVEDIETRLARLEEHEATSDRGGSNR